MYVGAALHFVLFPAWLIELGLGIHKAAQQPGGETARLSDLRQVSDQSIGTDGSQVDRVRAP